MPKHTPTADVHFTSRSRLGTKDTTSFRKSFNGRARHISRTTTSRSQSSNTTTGGRRFFFETQETSRPAVRQRQTTSPTLSTSATTGTASRSGPRSESRNRQRRTRRVRFQSPHPHLHHPFNLFPSCLRELSTLPHPQLSAAPYPPSYPNGLLHHLASQDAFLPPIQDIRSGHPYSGRVGDAAYGENYRTISYRQGYIPQPVRSSSLTMSAPTHVPQNLVTPSLGSFHFPYPPTTVPRPRTHFDLNTTQFPYAISTPPLFSTPYATASYTIPTQPLRYYPPYERTYFSYPPTPALLPIPLPC